MRFVRFQFMIAAMMLSAGLARAADLQQQIDAAIAAGSEGIG